MSDYKAYKPQIYDKIAISSYGLDYTVSPAKVASTTVLLSTTGTAYNFLYANNTALKNTATATTTSANGYIGFYAINGLDFVVERLVITNSSTSTAKVNLVALYPFSTTQAKITFSPIEIAGTDSVYLSRNDYDIVLHTGIVSTESLVGGTINTVLGYGLGANANQQNVQINGWGHFVRGD